MTSKRGRQGQASWRSISQQSRKDSPLTAGQRATLPESGGELIIGARYCGPPNSANGGYASGLLASFLESAVEVTLRLPPPLEALLTVRRSGLDRVELLDGERLLAEATRVEFDIDVPPAVSLPQAKAVAKPLDDHFFPTCFVCGPDAPHGLGIFPGPVGRDGVVAAPWFPSPEFEQSGNVRSEVVWAALDCPGGFAWAGEVPAFVLGRLAVKFLAPVPSTQLYVVMGWRRGRDGRKLYSGTAVVGPDEKVLAIGRATWIAIDGT